MAAHNIIRHYTDRSHCYAVCFSVCACASLASPRRVCPCVNDISDRPRELLAATYFTCQTTRPYTIPRYSNTDGHFINLLSRMILEIGFRSDNYFILHTIEI